jgi:hypothetical protein
MEKNLKIFNLHNCDFYFYNNSFDIELFKQKVKTIPAQFFQDCDKIYIYPSELLNDKGFDSLNYKNIIRINTDQIEDQHELVKSLIHELYHSVQNNIKNNINSQYINVCKEYILKKKKILDIFQNDNRFKPPKTFYYKTLEYNKDFDHYLHDIITYDVLYTRIIDIFPNAYSITSVDEYLAICIEIFFFEKEKWLLMYCPEAYKLIKDFINYER